MDGRNTELLSEQLFQYARNSINELLEICKVNKKQADEFMGGLDESCRLDFKGYIERLNSVTGIYDALDKQDKRLYKMSDKVCAMICDYENYYDILNSLTVLCNIKDKEFSNNKLPDSMAGLIDKFYKLYNYEGIMVNIRNRDGEQNLGVKLSRNTYKVKHIKTGNWYDSYNITIYLYKGMNVYEPLSFIYIPELYPKLFMTPYNEGKYTSITGIKDFSYMECKFGNYVYKESSSTGIREDRSMSKLAILPYRARNTKKLCTESEDAYMEEILNVVYYCLDRFINRKKIYKPGNNKVSTDKNSETNNTNIAIKTSNNKYVRLSDIVITENKGSNRSIRSNTHQSPCEHRRRGYWRKYKSGKMVWVKETIVNKGKQRVVYKV